MLPLPRPLVACYGLPMPPRRAVELRVGGQTYRVVASDNDQQVQRLAELVNRKFTEVVPQGRGMTGQQAMFLIAMAFAEEAEEQRARAARLEIERDRSLHLATRAREVVARLLERVDSALSALPAEGSKNAGPSPAAEPRIPSPLDHLTDPPDALHESLLIELIPPSTRDDGWRAPWGSAPPSAPVPALASVASTQSAAPSARGAGSSPPSPAADSANEAGVPRNPRPGLRLVRQSTPSDDEPR